MADPLSTLTDLQLQQAQLALQLACGRSHGALAHRRQGWYCFLGRVLDIERQARGLPAPPPTAHVSELQPFSL